MVEFKKIVIHSILLFILFFNWAGMAKAQERNSLDQQLLVAAETGKNDSLLLLLNKGARINCTTQEEGMTPLLLASQNGHIATVKLLILNGASINHQDIDQITALHLAVHFGHIDVAELLVKNGAKTNLKDYRGLTPLFYAAAYGDYVMTDMLLFFGATGSEKDETGKTPFLAAVWGNNIEVAALLRTYGINMQAQDNQGYTALMLAVENHNAEMVDSLLAWGNDVTLINKSGLNVLDIAYEEGQLVLVDKFLNRGVIRSKFPRWESLTAGPITVLNNDDYLGGLRMSLKDRRFLWALRFSYYQRLVRVPVTVQISPTIDQQFRESRSTLALGLSKEQIIFHPPGRNWMGWRVAMDVAMSLGSYRGTTKYPLPEFHLIPETGIRYQIDRWYVFAGYQYHKNRSGNISPHRFVFEAGFNIK